MVAKQSVWDHMFKLEMNNINVNARVQIMRLEYIKIVKMLDRKKY